MKGRGVMKRITLDGYDIGDMEATSPKTWVMLWAAVRQYPAGDTSQTRSGGNLVEALESIGISEIATQDRFCAECRRKLGEQEKQQQWHLKPEGGVMLIEEAEFELLKKILVWWREFKDRDGQHAVSLAAFKILNYADDIIEKAETVTKEELQGAKKGKKEKE
jgi:hypothetical protein